MQQRRLRLGDILDDYCPRERRITNHAVVAMIEDEVRQTRCTTCDAEHEYKQARVPSSRRKRPEMPGPGLAGAEGAEDAGMPAPSSEEAPLAVQDEAETFSAALAAGDDPGDQEIEEAPAHDDEGPVHRRLIRATLPRPEGQLPERKAPDFTIRQSGGRFDQDRPGQPRQRGRAPRHPQQPGGGQHARFGGPRQGNGQGAGQGQRPGNRLGGSDQRGGRPHGSSRGPRQGGQGRKRGR
jgi:hypothetical protein